jgi:GNAT superfamily N-acetyltransferase
MSFSNPLRDFVDLDFARRLELAETMLPDAVDSVRQHSPNSPIASAQIAGGTAFFGGLTYPANQIVGMGLYGDVSAEALDEVEEFFRSRGVPSTIVVSPLADPSLTAELGNRGYRIAEFNSVLIRPIGDEAPPTLPADVHIEPVTPRNASQWARTIAKGFSEFGEVPEDVFAGFAVLPGTLACLAYVGDAPAGGAAGRIIPQARIAALFGASTLPDYRRRGIQTALIARRLHEAARAGCEYAVVSTQPGSGSQRNMERRGFRLAYTKLVMAREWPATDPASSASGNDDGH